MVHYPQNRKHNGKIDPIDTELIPETLPRQTVEGATDNTTTHAKQKQTTKTQNTNLTKTLYAVQNEILKLEKKKKHNLNATIQRPTNGEHKQKVITIHTRHTHKTSKNTIIVNSWMQNWQQRNLFLKNPNNGSKDK